MKQLAVASPEHVRADRHDQEAIASGLGHVAGNAISVYSDADTVLRPEAEPDLYILRPTSPNYVELPVEEGFDWEQIVEHAILRHNLDVTSPLYLVVFRSKLKEGVDTTLLLEHDHRAHEAAKRSPALLYYFADEPDEEGRAISFCLWSERDAAKIASRDPDHEAAKTMVSMYESYSLERYSIDIDGPVSFTRHP